MDKTTQNKILGAVVAFLVAVGAAMAVLATSLSELITEEDVVADGGTEAGLDLDAGVDAGLDVGLDSGFDAGNDAGRDAGRDSGPVVSGDLRNLGTIPASFPSSHLAAWANPPVITRTVDVSTVAQLQSAISTPGTRARVSGVHNVSVYITANDIDLVMLDGASIQGVDVQRGRSRIAIHGGTFNRITLDVPVDYPSGGTVPEERLRVTDFLVERATIGLGGLTLRGVRMAVLGCDIHAENFSIWIGDTIPVQNTDVIVAHNRLWSNSQATHRMHDTVRSISYDNYYVNNVRHNYRVHGRSDYNLSYGNILTGTGFMLGTEPSYGVYEDRVDHMFFVRNTLYYNNVNGIFILPPHPNCSNDTCLMNLVLTDNVAYSTQGFSPPTRPGWTVSGNQAFAYVTPPAWVPFGTR